MTNQETILNISKLAKAFEKIFKGLPQNQLEALDQELIKIYPSSESEVLLSTDYSEDENSVGLSIYVSAPNSESDLQKMPFDKVMFQYLIYADMSKLADVWESIALMERVQGDAYDLDFIPVFYTEEIDKYDLHLRISKK